jgi:hypothetical protein
MKFFIGVVWGKYEEAIHRENGMDGSRIRMVVGVLLCRFLLGLL